VWGDVVTQEKVTRPQRTYDPSRVRVVACNAGGPDRTDALEHTQREQ
jgi:hypothetical protein